MVSLIVLPTDTVYGIGTDPFDPHAVALLLDTKGRDERMPPPVVLPDSTWLDRLAHFATEAERERAQKLAEAFWPGPLTLVVRTKQAFGWDLSKTGGTVALRVPDHPLALAELGRLGPLALTSANTTGNPPSRSVDEARKYFGESVERYVDGGKLGPGPVSTILDITGDDLRILREGDLGLEQLQAVLDEAEQGGQ